MAKRNYYEILGIPKNATKDEIKSSYKMMAKQYHPDLNKSKDAEEKFKEISEAYAVLSDDQKRAQYDQFGHEAFDQRFSQEDIFRNFDFDVFREFGNFDSIFNMFFGGRGGRRSEGGTDTRYDLKVMFEEAAFGTNKTIEVERHEICDACDGTGSSDGQHTTCDQCQGRGQVQKSRRTPFGVFTQVSACHSCQGNGTIVKNSCKKCRGSGLIKVKKDLKITIPPGVDNGTTIRLTGEGEMTDDRIAGDLYVVIHVMPHNIFEREGSDLYVEQKISFSTATLGDKVEVPTLDKPVSLKIPPGTQSHTTFRLNNMGIKKLHKNGYGDLFVRIIVEVPERLTKKQRTLIEDLGKEDSQEKKNGFKKFFS